MADIDWETINAKIPFKKDQKEERKELFKQFDPNGNGILSLAEVNILFILTLQMVYRVRHMF